MTATFKRFLNDYPAARWAALVLIALMMFFAYMFVDVMSPLKSLIESERGWDSSVFGTYAASEYILNVCGFLIIAGIILDKMGIRFTGVLSASLMVIGAGIKYIGISDWFQTTGMCAWLGSWWTAMPGSAKMAALGFMIFGCGCEMAGTTVSKAIAKWFKGKEMALAMGLEMAIARLGVFAVMWLSPAISGKFDGSVVAPLAFCTCLLLVGLINYIVFSVMDTRLDRQLDTFRWIKKLIHMEVKQRNELARILEFKRFQVNAFHSRNKAPYLTILALLRLCRIIATVPLEQHGFVVVIALRLQQTLHHSNLCTQPFHMPSSYPRT